MKQLVAEQMLVVLLAVVKTESPEPSAAVRQQVGDAAADQHLNEVVVQRPSRLVVTGHGQLDQAHRVVDHGGSDCERSTALVARDHERCLGPREQEGAVGLKRAPLLVTERGAPAAEDF